MSEATKKPPLRTPKLSGESFLTTKILSKEETSATIAKLPSKRFTTSNSASKGFSLPKDEG